MFIQIHLVNISKKVLNNMQNLTIAMYLLIQYFI